MGTLGNESRSYSTGVLLGRVLSKRRSGEAGAQSRLSVRKGPVMVRLMQNNTAPAKPFLIKTGHGSTKAAQVSQLLN